MDLNISDYGSLIMDLHDPNWNQFIEMNVWR